MTRILRRTVAGLLLQATLSACGCAGMSCATSDQARREGLSLEDQEQKGPEPDLSLFSD